MEYMYLCGLTLTLMNLLCRFAYMGPASHYVYLLMERLVPQDSNHAIIKRMLLERLVMTPPLMLAYLYLLFMLEVNYNTCIETMSKHEQKKHTFLNLSKPQNWFTTVLRK